MGEAKGEAAGDAANNTAGADPRVEAVAALLRREGIDGARVGVAGHRGEIAALEVPPDALPRLAELAPEVKAIGFRYVAVDMAWPHD
jgi:hypothetical protein